MPEQEKPRHDDQYRIPPGGQELYDNDHLYNETNSREASDKNKSTSASQSSIKPGQDSTPDEEEENPYSPRRPQD